MDIFQSVRNLGLPVNDYVVVGGGLLVALNLLEWDEDVDLTVNREIFNLFTKDGWRQDKWGDKIVLKKSIYDVGLNFGEWSLEDLRYDAVIIQGIPFINPHKLIEWKSNTARPKDLIHIRLLRDYLQNKNITDTPADSPS